MLVAELTGTMALYQNSVLKKHLASQDPISKMRKKHPNAYMPWSKEDDEYLEQLYCENLTVKQLSVVFGRNEGAIRSRVAKLELEDKY